MSHSDSEEVHQVTERQLVVYRPPVTTIVPRYWKFGDRAYCYPILGDCWELRRWRRHYRGEPFPTPQQVAEEYQILDNIISIRRTIHKLYKTKEYRGDWTWVALSVADFASSNQQHRWYSFPFEAGRPLTFTEATTPRSWRTQHFSHYYFPLTEFTATPSEQYYQIRDREYSWWRYLQLEREADNFDIHRD